MNIFRRGMMECIKNPYHTATPLEMTFSIEDSYQYMMVYAGDSYILSLTYRKFSDSAHPLYLKTTEYVTP